MEEAETESGTSQLEEEKCEINTISHTLTTAPHIVKAILSHLCAKQLYSCARVCTLWAETVNFLRLKRRTLSWTCIDCEDGETDNLQESVKEFLRTLYTEPAVLFMFCQTDLYDNPIRMSSPAPGEGRTRYSRRSKRQKKTEIGEYIKSLLPKKCELVGMTTDGIVGTSTDLTTRFEYEGHKGVSLLTLPRIEGVDVNVFTVDVYMAVTERLDIEWLIPFSNQKDVKLILFFSDNPDWSATLGYALLRRHPQASIAGGYVDNLVQPKPCHYQDSEPFPSLMCVAFSGKKVKVATIVARETVQTEESFEKEVQRLKNSGLSEKNSFAFMFACVGRGSGMYNKEDVETSVFKKYFPNTPIIGFFGNGEVGFDCSPNSPASGGDEKTANAPKMFHGYTTILTMVSILEPTQAQSSR